MRKLPTYGISLCLCLLSIFSSSDSECGKSGSCKQGHVIDGLHTCIEEFPWTSGLVDTSTIIINREIQIFCGASIITTKFLISAGHCFIYSKTQTDRKKNTVRVYIGLDNRIMPSPNSTYHTIESVDIHPDWLKNSYSFGDGNDIAIIKVKDAIKFSQSVGPICLPSVEQRNLVEVGRSVKLAGFGTTSASEISAPHNLLKGDFKILECSESNNICAAETKNGRVIRATCSGDSGSGLVGDDNGSYFLVGLVSWGKHCGETNFVTRYVNVFDHLEWINAIIEVCYTVQGSQCILPFRFEQNTYNQCVSSLPTLPDKTFAATCPTSLDSRGEGSHFENCNRKCSGFKEQIHGFWEQWGSWSRCTDGCESGERTRFRNCSKPQFGGHHRCKGDDWEDEQCNTRPECEEIPDRSCPGLDTCKTKETCPYIRNKYEEILQAATSDKKNQIISSLKSLICNKRRKAFCCPAPAFSGLTEDVGRDISRTRDQQAMPEAMADFTQAFYTHMANKNEGRNFAFSPMILHAALAMLYLGATPESNTERELGNSLYGTNARDTLKTAYKRITDFYKDDPSFNYGNRIWTNQYGEIKQNFTNQVLKNMGADSETTEFNGEAVDKVNKWVTQLTNGVIKDLVTEFDPDTKMFLTNVLYFKEDWQVDFSETDIQNDKPLSSEPFFIRGEEYRAEEVRVEMMEQIATSDTYRYGEIEMIDSQPAKVFTIPYRNPDFEMQIILPGTNNVFSNGLAILEDQMRRGTEKLQDQDYIRKNPLDPFNLFNSDKYIYRKPIEDIGIRMPKFKISQKVEVSNILQDLGVNQIFQAAELSQMTDAGQLTVSKVLHKAVIDVDHTGTTPAAAHVHVRPHAGFGERIRVDVNQPFIFIIQDTRNKIPILVGRVMDPRQII